MTYTVSSGTLNLTQPTIVIIIINCFCRQLYGAVLSCRHLPLTACSHRRHGQDKTRQFCLVRVGGVNKPKVRMPLRSMTADQQVGVTCVQLVSARYKTVHQDIATSAGITPWQRITITFYFALWRNFDMKRAVFQVTVSSSLNIRRSHGIFYLFSSVSLSSFLPNDELHISAKIMIFLW